MSNSQLSETPPQFGIRFLFLLMLLSGFVALVGRLVGWHGIFGLACLLSPIVFAMLMIWVFPASGRGSNRAELNYVDTVASRLPIAGLCSITFSLIHTILMWFIPVEGYGVPLGTIVIWLVADFPISWVVFFVLEFELAGNVAIGESAGHAIFLVTGSFQWGLWGWLLGKATILLFSPPR